MNVLWRSIRRGCVTLMSRPVFYVLCVVVVPLAMTAFFVSLLEKGVAEHVPSAVVDLDHSDMSRNVTRNLGALQQVDIRYKLDSYAQAMDYVNRGEIMGFFMIPENFGEDALAGRHPELTYYINFGYIVPGSLLVEGYTTMSMLANGAVVQGLLSAKGVPEVEIKPVLQPFVNQVHLLGNPTMNYGVYLVNSFAPGVLALMVLLVVAYNITAEIKNGTTREWLDAASGSIVVALVGKLLPITMLFTIVGWTMHLVFYGIAQYPMNGEMWVMMLAMFLLVVACESLAVIVCAIVPNPRYALSVCSLIGVLAFSLGGYSFPVEDMYSGIGIFSHLLPMRYYFLIYVDQALNGLELAYSRDYFMALLAFPFVALLFLCRLKKSMQRPVVYVP